MKGNIKGERKEKMQKEKRGLGSNLLLPHGSFAVEAF